LPQVADELGVVFSTLASCGTSDRAQAERDYDTGLCQLLPHARPAYKPIAGFAAALDWALDCLDRLPANEKARVIGALASTVSHDQRLTLEEAELLRAITASLHCPLPPLVHAAALAHTAILDEAATAETTG
jgi:hypothetical protein